MLPEKYFYVFFLDTYSPELIKTTKRGKLLGCVHTINEEDRSESLRMRENVKALHKDV